MQLVSPVPQQQGNFGISVSVDTMIAVGAPREAVGAMSGAGNVYTFDTVTGAPIKKLTSPKPEANGNFGASVATLGNMVVVGAPHETSGGQMWAGRAYVFNGQTGALIAAVTSPNPQPFGFFGWKCSLNQANNIIAVGAPQESVAGIQYAGRAYTFSALTGVLKSSFATPNPVWNGVFGATVVAGDSATFVCAPYETSGTLTGAGRVYAYNATTGAPLGAFVSPAPQPFGFFGCSLVLYQNLMAVGEFGATVGGQFSAGRVQLYSNGALATTLTDPVPASNAAFGWSLVMGQWRHTLVIGACECPSATQFGSGLGRMLVLRAQTGFSLVRTMTTGSTAVMTDFFGYASALGQQRIAIGQPTDIVAGLFGAGRVYVFIE